MWQFTDIKAIFPPNYEILFFLFFFFFLILEWFDTHHSDIFLKRISNIFHTSHLFVADKDEYKPFMNPISHHIILMKCNLIFPPSIRATWLVGPRNDMYIYLWLVFLSITWNDSCSFSRIQNIVRTNSFDYYHWYMIWMMVFESLCFHVYSNNSTYFLIHCG